MDAKTRNSIMPSVYENRTLRRDRGVKSRLFRSQAVRGIPRHAGVQDMRCDGRQRYDSNTPMESFGNYDMTGAVGSTGTSLASVALLVCSIAIGGGVALTLRRLLRASKPTQRHKP